MGCRAWGLGAWALGFGSRVTEVTPNEGNKGLHRDV